MTRKTFYSLFLCLFALCLLSSKCGKDNPPPEPQEPTLPEATQTGANTFGCKVNGQVYLPNGNSNYPSVDDVAYYQSLGRIVIRTRNRYDFEHMYLTVLVYIKDGAFTTGNYKGYGDEIYPCLQKQKGNSIYDYYSDSSFYSNIEITRLDQSNKILSGLFEFDCYNESEQDTFKITEGRFDLKNIVIIP